MGYKRFELGKTYMTNAGVAVKIVGVVDTKGYECVQGDDFGDDPKGGHRYNRPGDLGRCTGTDHDGSDPRNLIPERDDTLSRVEYRHHAVPFTDEDEVRLAIMEARGAGGICAGEPAGAFRHERVEGEPGFYVVHNGEDDTRYLSRGIRGRRGLPS